jgi:hypothetical protein
MLKPLKTIRLLALLLATARPAVAQTAPAPADEGDDLELPASPPTAPIAPPAGTPSAPPAPAAPVVAPAAPAAAPSAPAASVAPSNAVVAAPAVPSSESRPPSPAPVTEAPTPALPLSHGLQISGYVQAEFQANQLSEDQLQQGGLPLNQDRFLVRRARLRLDRDWDYAAATLELDANTVSGVTFGIRRAEGSLLYRGSDDLRAAPLLMLTLGVTDIPFGYELTESSRTRDFMERSLGSTALFPTEADLGLKLSGAVGFLRYGLALSNGEPVNNNGFPRDPNAAKDLTGRIGVEVNPARPLTVWGGVSFGNGKGFHAGQDAKKAQLVWRDLDGSGDIVGGAGNVVRVNEISVIPASAASPSSNFDRWVLGADLGAELETGFGRSKLYAEAFVASNYDRGLTQADPIASGVDVRHFGAYAAVLQDVTAYGLVGFRGGFYDPNSDVLEQRRGRIVPFSQTIYTLSPLAGFVLKERAKLLFQYDFVIDELARDNRGVPTDAENDLFTARLQVEL